MNIRSVGAAHGWQWIAAGVLIFRENPLLWLLLIGMLFIGSRLLFAIPLIGVIGVLIAPNFLAGLCHGAQALEEGKPLRPGYLASGFLRNAASLITLGGISLLGHFLALMAILVVSGDVIGGISNTLTPGGAVTQKTIDAMRDAAPQMTMALIAGLSVILPFVMATWFSPLLVFFDDMKPLPAMIMSFRACLTNALPLLLYGMAVLVPVMIFMPVSLAARQPDLGFWLLAPVLAPSVYASYRDLFVPTPAEGRLPH